MKTVLMNVIYHHLNALHLFDYGQELSLEEARSKAGILPMYQRWLEEIVRIFVQEKYVRYEQGQPVLLAHQFTNKELWALWDEKKGEWLKYQDLQAYALLMDATVPNLADILVGKKTAPEVIFPHSSLKLVENTYKHNQTSIYFNQALAQQALTYIEQQRAQNPTSKVRILEVGAGTGATSAVVLEALKSVRSSIAEYCYTDISKAFLNHAEATYGPSNPFLTYKIFNVERGLPQSNIEAGCYDLVIAANVLHATKNIKETMQHVRHLLKSNGVIFLNEITQNNLINHVTFGLLEGWWRYEDPELRVPGCPLLSDRTWQQVLESVGFDAVNFPCHDALDLGQQIIVASNKEQFEMAVAVTKEPVNQALHKVTKPPIHLDQPEKTHAHQHIEQTIINEIATSLRIDKRKINPQEPFSSYGFDSIIAVNLTRAIAHALAINLDITIMFEYNTVEQLTQFIVAQNEDKFKTPVRPNKPEFTNQLPLPTAVTESKGIANNEHTDVAIIGLSASFPQAESIVEFWDNLIKGTSAITKAPLERIDWSEFSEEKGFTLNNKWGGFLDNIDGFDPLFFGISPKEAQYMSPEQRLLLMHIWNALENAGVTPNTLAQDATGVFIAVGPSDYNHLKVYSPQTQLETPGLMSSPSLSLIPNRISYFLDLHGPSEYCETACSSSLVALHRAVQSIQQGECSQAIIAGVNLLLSPMSYLGLEAADMLSPTGTPKPFQDDANGLVKGEGVGALLIKSLAQAETDNDFIYAVIKGTGVAHGGKGISFTAPNGAGMKAAMLMAYKNAGIDPATVSYIETQGVGSSLADSAEISALKSGMVELLGKGTAKSMQTCYLSNLKPYMGHAEIFSGMASLIKVILALHHRQIPAIPAFKQPNCTINLEDSAFKFATVNQPWPIDANTPRRASINGYGIGGVNAHTVLEDYKATEPTREIQESYLVVLSAKSNDRLLRRAQLLHEFIGATPDSLLSDIAYTLQTGREAMPERVAFVVSSLNELQNALQLFATASDQQSQCFFTGTIEQQNAEIMELFSGQIGDILLNLLHASGKLEQLARYWVMGAPINWDILYKVRNAKRIPLPSYPFALQSCWLNSPKQKGSKVTLPSIVFNENGSESFIRSILSLQLGISPEKLNARTQLQHYGLNSIMFVTIAAQIRTQFPTFSPGQLTSEDTIASLIEKLNTTPHQPKISTSTHYFELIHLNSVHQGKPIFWIHGGLGGVESYVAIATVIKRPFYAIQARGFMAQDKPTESIPEMARYYIKLIKSIQPNGPYDLGGFCLGGIISYEITRQLQSQQEQVSSMIMIDSPDNTALRNAPINNDNAIKNAALQVTNMLLWPAAEQNYKKILAQLIHQNELDNTLKEKEFILSLAKKAKNMGLKTTEKQIEAFIKRNVEVQTAYQIGGYNIAPLPQPNGVQCYYFRNTNDLFYGNLRPYLSVKGDTFSLDKINYWQDWEKEMPNMQIIDIKARNHMLILTEKKSLKYISKFCEQLYTARESVYETSTI